MNKTVATLVAAAVTGAGLAALPAPAIAQNSRIAEVVVYGNDPCPRSSDDEVVVCARKPEAERYRLPEQYRSSGTRQQREAWANRATAFETMGATGINSCSAVGPGGHTGCLQNIINQARDEREEQIAGDTPPE